MLMPFFSRSTTAFAASVPIAPMLKMARSSPVLSFLPLPISIFSNGTCQSTTDPVPLGYLIVNGPFCSIDAVYIICLSWGSSMGAATIIFGRVLM